MNVSEINISTTNRSQDIMTNHTLDELNQLQLIKHLPVLIFYMFLMVIGIVGNLLVLIIYKLRMKRSSARVYILSLALADLSVCIVGIPYHGLDLTRLLNYTFTNVCKVLSFLIGACTLSSVFILLVVGLDRYLKVCRPLKKQIVDFGNRKACVMAAIVAVIIAIPNGVLYGQSKVVKVITEPPGVACFIDDYYIDSTLAIGYFGFNVVVFILSVIFLIIIYGFICGQIYEHDKVSCEISLKATKTVCFCFTFDAEENVDEIEEDNDKEDEIDMSNLLLTSNEMKPGATSSENQIPETLDNKATELQSATESGASIKNKPSFKHSEPTALRASNRGLIRDPNMSMTRHRKSPSKNEAKYTKKITLMMFTITIVFIASYLPFIVISIVHATDVTFWAQLSDDSTVFIDFLLRFYLVNNVANPIIYSFWDKKFRREIVRLIRSIICCFTKTREKDGKHVSSVNNSSSSSSRFTEHTIK